VLACAAGSAAAAVVPTEGVVDEDPMAVGIEKGGLAPQPVSWQDL
jgi:hypothetical protein